MFTGKFYRVKLTLWTGIYSWGEYQGIHCHVEVMSSLNHPNTPFWKGHSKVVYDGASLYDAMSVVQGYAPKAIMKRTFIKEYTEALKSYREKGIPF